MMHALARLWKLDIPKWRRDQVLKLSRCNTAVVQPDTSCCFGKSVTPALRNTKERGGARTNDTDR